jgi:hypothetical protein
VEPDKKGQKKKLVKILQQMTEHLQEEIEAAKKEKKPAA